MLPDWLKQLAAECPEEDRRQLGRGLNMKQVTEVQKDTVLTSTFWFDVLEPNGDWVCAVERNNREDCEKARQELIDYGYTAVEDRRITELERLAKAVIDEFYHGTDTTWESLEPLIAELEQALQP